MRKRHRNGRGAPGLSRRVTPEPQSRSLLGRLLRSRPRPRHDAPPLGNRLVRIFGHGILGLIALSMLMQIALIHGHQAHGLPKPTAQGADVAPLITAAVLRTPPALPALEPDNPRLAHDTRLALTTVAMRLPPPPQVTAAVPLPPSEPLELPVVPHPAVLKAPGDLRTAILKRKVHFHPFVRQDCIPPALRGVIYDIAERFGSVRIGSTHRSPSHNSRVGGARRSMHLQCRAIDFFVDGNPRAIAAFIRAHPRVGGFKRYPTGHYHIDDGPRRTW